MVRLLHFDVAQEPSVVRCLFFYLTVLQGKGHVQFESFSNLSTYRGCLEGRVVYDRLSPVINRPISFRYLHLLEALQLHLARASVL